MSLSGKIVLKILETGLMPERISRCWISYLCRLACERASLGDIEARHSVFRQIVKDLKVGIKLRHKDLGNEQPAEMESDFFEMFLGKRLSTTCGYFPTGAEDLEEAEDTMLWMSSDRARIRDGMKILELGCGWGAMSFWLARQYPEAQITSVSDSVGQGIYLQKKAHELGLENIKIITAEFGDLDFKNKFDRIISLERFDLFAGDSEWQQKVHSWLESDGKFFLQAPVHSDFSFYLDSVGFDDLPGNYVSKNRVTLGADMPLLFQKFFHVEDFWKISGENYRATAERWLKRFYFNRLAILPCFEKAYGKRNAWTWFQRWRLHLIALCEQYGFNRGQSWIVGQYLYSRKEL